MTGGISTAATGRGSGTAGSGFDDPVRNRRDHDRRYSGGDDPRPLAGKHLFSSLSPALLIPVMPARAGNFEGSVKHAQGLQRGPPQALTNVSQCAKVVRRPERLTLFRYGKQFGKAALCDSLAITWKVSGCGRRRWSKSSTRPGWVSTVSSPPSAAAGSTTMAQADRAGQRRGCRRGVHPGRTARTRATPVPWSCPAPGRRR